MLKSFKIVSAMESEHDTKEYEGHAKRRKIEGVRNGERCRSDRPGGVKTSAKERGSVMLPVELEQSEDEYKIENTVIVNVEGKEVEADDIIDCIEELCGEDTVFACVLSAGNTYEVTMMNGDCKDAITPTLQIGDTTVSVSSVSDKSTMVSILHLPTYISDKEIVEKIQSYNIQIISPIYRKYRKTRKRRKRRIADGTRYFRVKFPKEITSLPWFITFEIRGTSRYFRTIHDNQVRVCFKCCSVDHLARNCPLNKCYSCFEYGHISWDCPMILYKDSDETINECQSGSGSGNENESADDRSDNQTEKSTEDDTITETNEDGSSERMEMNENEIEEENKSLSNNEDSNHKRNEESYQRINGKVNDPSHQKKRNGNKPKEGNEAKIEKQKNQKTRKIQVEQFAETHKMRGVRREYTSTRNSMQKIGKESLHDNT